jgi:hypothetical protein
MQPTHHVVVVDLLPAGLGSRPDREAFENMLPQQQRTRGHFLPSTEQLQ